MITDATNAEDSPDLDLGVIYTHEQAWIGPLLESLAVSGPGLRMRLLLVDNASGSGVDAWRRIVPETQVLTNASRLGYAANLNRILGASTARHVLLLNTDMRFEPAEQSLTQLVQYLDAEPSVGIVGCRLHHLDGAFAFPARRFPTWRAIAARRLGVGGRLARAAADHLYQERRPTETFDCDWLSGCLLCVRRACHRQLGPLDEHYWKYFEDVDYCARAWQSGWRVAYFGRTYVYHFEQRASKRWFSMDSVLHLRAYARWLWRSRRYPRAFDRADADPQARSTASVQTHRAA
ncbi:MAG: glycosyltransferase [Pirellulales bacterium]|nr:glycosyltransferase [Pirellulales bacterium]